ncbi:TolC family protein [Sphingomonas sp. 7/4-4]|uniref:TolC family protein n=1 Tax=Sphingomonas sp. 7/4-4 TaxID=3018446 RepID=UPI00300E1293
MKRLSLLAAGLLSACAVGPNYQRPATPPTAAGNFVDPGVTKVSTGIVEGEWWHLFRDPALDRLVVDALAHNTDIRVAAANLRRARALLSEARNQRLPTTDLSASYTRQRQERTRPISRACRVPSSTSSRSG